MQTHLLNAEIDPLHYVERLPLPPPYPFEQLGNLCFMDEGFSGYASELRSIGKERSYRVGNQPLDLPRRQSPSGAPSVRCIRWCRNRRRAARDVIAISPTRLHRMARSERHARLVEELSSQWTGPGDSGSRRARRGLCCELFLNRVPSLRINDRRVLALVAFSSVGDPKEVVYATPRGEWPVEVTLAYSLIERTGRAVSGWDGTGGLYANEIVNAGSLVRGQVIFTAVPVPEPGTGSLVLLGMLGLAVRRSGKAL